MKTFKTLAIAIFILAFAPVKAQTADEIINNYLENIGGESNWEKVEGIRMKAIVNQQGLEIPVEIVQLKDGRQMTSIMFQGQTLKQGVYDGETLWAHNFLTQKAEKSDAEATENYKLDVNDFPSQTVHSFINYKEKGYSIELLGKETVEGTETFKVKITQEPIKVDGKEEPNISFYYFDTENFVPIVIESEIRTGPQKGSISQVTLSDYQEVDGLFFPFSISQGVKGGGSQPISLDTIELNPQVEASEFAFPEEK